MIPITSPRPRRLHVRAAAIAAMLVMSTSLAVFAHAPFSLIAQFASTWTNECSDGYGICGDSLSPYNDLVNGTEVYSNDFGNVTVQTSNSPTRRICLDFPEQPTKIHDETNFTRFVPAGGLDNCYAAAFNTLANPDYGATDVGSSIGSPQSISAWIYFFVNGLQYELHWKRQGYGSLESSGPPLKVSYSPGANSPATDSWLLESFAAGEIGAYASDFCPNCKEDPDCPAGCVTLVVFSNKQPRGRVALANYVMPISLVVQRSEPNLRKSKGRK